MGTDTNIALRVVTVLRNHAMFLLLGTLGALVWANVDSESYHYLLEYPLFTSAWLNPHHDHAINFHFLVNDVFMVLFFGIATKEVLESVLPGGALSSVRKASLPALATIGGVIGPVAVFFTLHTLLEPEPVFWGGWAIPTATDIAYCWLFAGLIFGRGHPAVSFLLVLAVLDDLIGMCIIAIFYTPSLHLGWLGLVGLAMALCWLMQRNSVVRLWPYLVIGAPLSWLGLNQAGVHAALALVPIVPFLPHSGRDLGLFVSDEGHHPDDTLSRFGVVFSPIVEVGLFTFGLANAGVLLTGDAFLSKPAWIILLSLLIGKTLGIAGFSAIGHLCGLQLPEGLRLRQTIVLGMVAGIGFTVALFVTTVFLDTAGASAESIADQLKLGALLSFLAAPMGYLLSKLLGTKRAE